MLTPEQILLLVVKHWPDRHLITSVCPHLNAVCVPHNICLSIRWDGVDYVVYTGPLIVREAEGKWTRSAKTLTKLLRKWAIEEFGSNYDSNPLELVTQQ